MAFKPRTLTDAADLKALAHPLRMDILEVLLLKGPCTATQVAAELGSTPSNCSWHLRKLAEHGFVSEVAGSTGRNRPWQAVSQGLRWDEAGAREPEAGAAGRALTDLLLSRELQWLRAAQESAALETPEWQEATTLVQSALWLTAEEAKQISEQLKALLLTHFDRLEHPDRRPEGARLVSAVGWLTPRPEPGSGRTTEQTDGTRDNDSDDNEESR
jgi:DNA-binding transcriptional ArsR family regulator